MNLSYRGQAYIPSNTVAFVNVQSALTYRGQSYQHSTTVAVTPKAKLTYRGVPYLQSQTNTIRCFYPVFN